MASGGAGDDIDGKRARTPDTNDDCDDGDEKRGGDAKSDGDGGGDDESSATLATTAISEGIRIESKIESGSAGAGDRGGGGGGGGVSDNGAGADDDATLAAAAAASLRRVAEVHQTHDRLRVAWREVMRMRRILVAAIPDADHWLPTCVPVAWRPGRVATAADSQVTSATAAEFESARQLFAPRLPSCPRCLTLECVAGGWRHASILCGAPEVAPAAHRVGLPHAPGCEIGVALAAAAARELGVLGEKAWPDVAAEQTERIRENLRAFVATAPLPFPRAGDSCTSPPTSSSSSVATDFLGDKNGGSSSSSSVSAEPRQRTKQLFKEAAGDVAADIGPYVVVQVVHEAESLSAFRPWHAATRLFEVANQCRRHTAKVATASADAVTMPAPLHATVREALEYGIATDLWGNGHARRAAFGDGDGDDNENAVAAENSDPHSRKDAYNRVDGDDEVPKKVAKNRRREAGGTQPEAAIERKSRPRRPEAGSDRTEMAETKIRGAGGDEENVTVEWEAKSEIGSRIAVEVGGSDATAPTTSAEFAQIRAWMFRSTEPEVAAARESGQVTRSPAAATDMRRQLCAILRRGQAARRHRSVVWRQNDTRVCVSDLVRFWDPRSLGIEIEVRAGSGGREMRTHHRRDLSAAMSEGRTRGPVTGCGAAALRCVFSCPRLRNLYCVVDVGALESDRDGQRSSPTGCGDGGGTGYAAYRASFESACVAQLVHTHHFARPLADLVVAYLPLWMPTREPATPAEPQLPREFSRTTVDAMLSR